jgi:predicted Fe-Mo cluster-binding NifX family protein
MDCFASLAMTTVSILRTMVALRGASCSAPNLQICITARSVARTMRDAMKIAIATKDWQTVSGHAGKSKYWLLYDFGPAPSREALPAPSRIELEKAQILHYFQDDGPHPLDGVDVVVAGSAGDGFVRHMKNRGADVLLTGETDPAAALTRILSGEPLPDQRFDITTTLCKLRDMFSRH